MAEEKITEPEKDKTEKTRKTFGSAGKSFRTGKRSYKESSGSCYWFSASATTSYSNSKRFSRKFVARVEEFRILQFQIPVNRKGILKSQAEDLAEKIRAAKAEKTNPQ